MNNDEEKIDPFIDFLEKHKEDRGMLAALRRGLGQTPGQAPEMYPYVIRFLPEKHYASLESAYYQVASLFALHPSSTTLGNMGDHLAATIHREEERQSVERRFTNLLKAHIDDLHVYLHQAVAILKSDEISVNWNQLLHDLKYWDHPQFFIQKRWAEHFWGKKNRPVENVETEKESK